MLSFARKLVAAHCVFFLRAQLTLCVSHKLASALIAWAKLQMPPAMERLYPRSAEGYGTGRALLLRGPCNRCRQQLRSGSLWQRHQKSLASQAAATSAPQQRQGAQRDFRYPHDFDIRYDLQKKIGQGSFGTVHVAVDKRKKEKVAVKVMTKRFGPDGNLEPHFLRRIVHEVDILNHIGRSLNVIYLYGAYEDSQKVYLVMELCSGGELWQRVQQGSYSEKEAAQHVREVLRVVAQCHLRNVIVRDVKPDNFLYLHPSPDAPLKGVDFGMAEYCQPGQMLSDRAGTAVYVAPEVLRQKYSQPADVWSAGILAYQLLTGRLPFSGEEGDEVSEVFQQRKVFDNRDVFRAVLYSDLDFESPPWDTLSADAKDLLQAMLLRDPEKRISAHDALHHRWLSYQEPASETPLHGSIVQRLQRFGTYGRIKQVALRAVAHHIATDSQLVAELREVFQELDKEQAGKVHYNDVVETLRSGRFQLSEPELRQLMAGLVDEMDEEGDVQYDSWVAAMLDWRAVQDSDEWHAWVERVFQAFDSDHSGELGIEDLQAMLCGETCPVPDTVDAALRDAHHEGKGGITFEEFEKMMLTAKDDDLDLYESRLRPDPR